MDATASIEDLRDAIARLLAFWGNQLGGTFLAPGSTLAAWGLLLSLLLAALLAVPRGRTRAVRLRVLIRALLPRRLHASASGRADLAYFVFSLFFAGLVFGSALLSSDAIGRAVSAALTDAFGPTRPMLSGWLATATVTAALFVAYEFAYWLDHFLSHRIPLLWQFHRVHHAAESLSLLTNFRVHPLDTLVFANIVALVTGLVSGMLRHGFGDAPVWGIGGTNALVMLSAVLLTHLQHSHLWVTFGPFWGRWLLSPAHHQIHHSADPAHFDRNFGSSLALFDRLFGTLHMPAPTRERLRFGLEEAHAHGWHAAVIAPFANALALLPRPRLVLAMRKRRIGHDRAG